ncbi:MAG: outer membrane protein, OmpA/MotB family [Acidobacteria bacterium]|jgi:outer membrane protein OmpA-like peptidoglycan-associated protein|nr:outer membrane protein, OmpA/MotB family [Acidobacteriota bacterium]
MHDTQKRIVNGLLIAVLTLIVAAFASSAVNNAVAQAPAARSATSGEKVTFEGVIVSREAESFVLQTVQGTNVTVRLTSATQIKEKKSNIFRKANAYTASQLLRGLNVEVKGRNEGANQVVADQIRAKDVDMRVARNVESRVEPVEKELAATEVRLSQSEKNAQQLSGQIAEVSTLTNAARSAAKAAQETADSAGSAAKSASANATAGIEKTNARINGLDDYEARTKASILFKVGSAVLSKDAQAELDKIAQEAKNEKAYYIDITGFASSEGSEDINRRLSQRRAEAVIQYLVENHDIPLRRLLTPMGIGEKRPVADNTTREGRTQNRRVEVTILVNKILAAK